LNHLRHLHPVATHRRHSLNCTGRVKSPTTLAVVAALVMGGPLVKITAAQPAATTPAASRPAIARALALPATLRTQPSLTSVQQDAVRKFIKTEVAAMAAGDPAVQTSARRNLVLASHNLVGGKPTPATPAYQQVFGEALNDALAEQLKHADARIRLNAAVTLANVAERMTQGPSLFKAAMAALQDKAEPVVMWGVRGAKDI